MHNLQRKVVNESVTIALHNKDWLSRTEIFLHLRFECPSPLAQDFPHSVQDKKKERHPQRRIQLQINVYVVMHLHAKEPICWQLAEVRELCRHFSVLLPARKVQDLEELSATTDSI